MEVTIRSIGNSKGVLLPKPLLIQVGLENELTVDVSVEGGAILLRKPAKPTRVGWAQAAQVIASQHEDTLLMGEFVNDDDQELDW
jgi:antitoxin MazE